MWLVEHLRHMFNMGINGIDVGGLRDESETKSTELKNRAIVI